MIRTSARGALVRLLAAAGLTRRAHAEHERQRATAHARSAERARANRHIEAAAAKLRALQERFRGTEERLAAAHAERDMLQQRVRHLAHADAERAAAAHRLTRAQLAIAVKAARRRGVTAASDRRVTLLSSLCPDYPRAAARWRAGDLPSHLRCTTTARLRWSAPGDTGAEGSQPSASDASLPLDDFAAVRDFAVGGIMLDIGADIGPASIPRVILGDFARAYAAEPDSGRYLCLVGNTLDNACEGRVLPQRVAIAGSAGPGKILRLQGDFEEVPFQTLDAWLTRLRVAPAGVRFIRLRVQEWNMDVDRGAAYTLKHPHIVWQIEIDPALLRDAERRIGGLCARLATHFTHLQELGSPARPSWRSASDLAAVVEVRSGEGRTANLLLFNMAGRIG